MVAHGTELLGLAMMVGIGWANSHPGGMNRLIKHYSHLSGDSSLVGKDFGTLSGCSRVLTIACSLISWRGH